METYIWVSLVLNAINVILVAVFLSAGQVPYTTTVTPFDAVLRITLGTAAIIWAAKLLGVL